MPAPKKPNTDANTDISYSRYDGANPDVITRRPDNQSVRVHKGDSWIKEQVGAHTIPRVGHDTNPTPATHDE